ncbi:ATP-binding cassette subfamily F protein 3 [Natranaerovirga pectinivora]|uniref:ATP-binding cassette subfamily F protein 3 n=1 Tax=Natranaerovirga pectinivora TaxID=682400 RepID=A0A4R3MQ87_9FIRM|nr:ABC-F family ATP-binding cassette domain-containing protein [Natranaerovirga pectinivora]TCT15331.1 ATP-binding cassette subfamily F protein 3 [Natranaerovirga pectinivora]
MILACKNISKSFGITPILNNVSFHIEKGEKIGLVGVNGAGKTTLFKILSGHITPDEGQIIIPNQINLGYLSQEQDLNSNSTIYDEMLDSKKDILELEIKIKTVEKKMKEATSTQLETLMNEYAKLQQKFEDLDGYSYQSEIRGVLKGLGFVTEDHSKTINTLSGGQKTRVSLAKLLLMKPDLILLDEPTNHLDMNSISWLENYINTYDGSLIIISHDRYFLNKTVNKIIEIENTQCKIFIGNYSDYAEKKAIDRDVQLKHYMNQQKEIKKQEEVITQLRSFNREKSVKRARSREKALNKIDVLDKPQELKTDMNLQLEPQVISGNDVLAVNSISKSFDDRMIFENISFDIKKGDKIALIGDNGTGKTTILKIILGELEGNTGDVKLGSKVKCGYFDQEYTSLTDSNNLIEEISNAYPNMKTGEIRNILAAFLFIGDDVFKQVYQLSGGEKGRLSLAKLMLSEANFLLLDEPTNHLDIFSKEVLENALNQYTGTILYISHDRYFINRTATRVLELTPTGVTNYLGNYDYFVEKKETQSKEISNENMLDPKSMASTKDDWIKKKENQAKERKRLAELSKLEASILEKEKRIEEIDAALCLEENYTNHIILNELNDEKSALEMTLLSLYDLWETHLEE